MSKYTLNLIGPFGLFTANGNRIEITSQKGMALLAFIALGPHGVRARRKLEAMFWGDRAPKQAKESLRREVSNCRKALIKARAEELLVSDMQRVALDMDALIVDVGQLEKFEENSTAIVAGELLEGIDLPECDEFEDWLRIERDRVAQLLEDACVREASAASCTTSIPTAPSLSHSETIALAPKPSLAALPFLMMDQSQDAWRGAAFSEALASCLSEYPQLLVVSSNAAAEIARESSERSVISQRLNARYLIEGSVFPADVGLRVIVKIIDGDSGEQVWTGDFTGEQDEGLSLERAIASAVAPQIWTGIDINERRRLLRLPSPARSNYEKYWQANALFRSWQRDDVVKAASIATELVEADPACPWATSLAALTHAIGYVMGVLPDSDSARAAALAYCETASRVGVGNVEAMGYCAGTLVLTGGDFGHAERIVANALLILPDHQPTLFWGGWIDLHRDDPARAKARFERALIINPASGAQGQMFCGIAFAHMMVGEWDSAAASIRKAEALTPEFPMVAIGTELVGGAEADSGADSAAGRPRITGAMFRGAIESLPDLIRQSG